MERSRKNTGLQNNGYGIMRRIILLLAIIIAGAYQTVLGQNVAVKTNLLNDAFLNPNIGIEVGLAPKWTLEAAGQFNAWNLSHDRRWKHWALQPLRHAIGSVTASVHISLAYTCMAANII